MQIVSERADGLVDAVIEDPAGEEGLQWAAEFAQQDGTHSQTRERRDKIAEAHGAPGTVAQLAAGPLHKAKDPYAAQAAVDAMAAGIEVSFETGAQVEREKIDERRQSPEPAAQRYLFAAERAARKPRNLNIGAARSVARAGVVGAGTMGGGIAMALAAAGIPVTIVEAEQDALDCGRHGPAAAGPAG
ncbi:3-hydroxyacyl-CoA dehydrogenase NAD-binding domain-containing protein [Arthrobacter sp. A5]|uniref:3-hydroxyacyl-CoA dehydrogenase NAD-binding domain-containing protein n=1 Tax=Arthrobacter sp. A5 TaxID=576926 RepID=UPI003DA8BECC